MVPFIVKAGKSSFGSTGYKQPKQSRRNDGAHSEKNSEDDRQGRKAEHDKMPHDAYPAKKSKPLPPIPPPQNAPISNVSPHPGISKSVPIVEKSKSPKASCKLKVVPPVPSRLLGASPIPTRESSEAVTTPDKVESSNVLQNNEDESGAPALPPKPAKMSPSVSSRKSPLSKHDSGNSCEKASTNRRPPPPLPELQHETGNAVHQRTEVTSIKAKQPLYNVTIQNQSARGLLRQCSRKGKCVLVAVSVKLLVSISHEYCLNGHNVVF